eukprot:3984421-Amphidinium_carterae.1
MKVALGAEVECFNIDLKELEKSSEEYLWYSVLTENQFTTYSQGEGHMPVYRYLGQAEGLQKPWKLHSKIRHALARFQHVQQMEQ